MSLRVVCLVTSCGLVLSLSCFGKCDDLSPVQLIKQYCFDCHAEGASEGNLALDQLLNQSPSPESRAKWWKVLDNVRAQTMPPPSAGAKLTKSERERLSHWLKLDAMGIDPANPDPGRVTLKRLNRREYANTIRDLLGIDFEADIAFPPDDTGFGFDNIGDTLSLSPMVVEKFLAAASQIVTEAVPKTNYEIAVQQFFASDIRSTKGRGANNMHMDKAHRVGLTFELPHDGSYQLEIVIKANGSFQFSRQRCTLACNLDNQPLFEDEYGWEEMKRYQKQFAFDWKSGEHRIDFELTPLDIKDLAKDSSFAELDIESVIIRGPEDRKFWRHPKGYDRVFTRDQAPEDFEGQRAYAREVLETFGLRAFRRPVDSATLDRLVQIAEHFLQQPDTTFEAAIGKTLIPLLASPRFLFRIENVESNDHTSFPLIDEFALASRLSYFLWSSMPDEELFELAKAGRLRAQLDDTVRRMLKDPKSKSLARNFAGQWLRINDVEKVSIDPLVVKGLQAEYNELNAANRKNKKVPQDSQSNDAIGSEVADRRKRFAELSQIRKMWDTEIRTAMRNESEMLFEFIASENRDLAEIVDPGYTFLNERLAKHYGIDGVQGAEMRRVELPADSVRGGILTHGTMLTVTSNPTRTSPVKRGLYVLENILGTPTPPAPPNVPALEDSSGKFGDRTPTLKELLTAHRDSELCSSCHSRMDPLGLALENFDALGSWREKEEGQAIDASGQLITGETFRDFRDLRKIIANQRREDFYRCVAVKMFVYALGRGNEYYDEYTLDLLVDRLLKNGGKFNELIYGIVQSAAFQRQRAAEKTDTLANHR